MRLRRTSLSKTAQIDQMRQVELAEIAKMLNVEQSRINQELRVALSDEDRKIDVANKQQVTALAEKGTIGCRSRTYGCRGECDSHGRGNVGRVAA